MSKVVRQRVKALLVSAVMAVSSVAVTSVGSIFATAAGTTVTVNKSLESSIEDPEDPDQSVHIFVRKLPIRGRSIQIPKERHQ